MKIERHVIQLEDHDLYVPSPELAELVREYNDATATDSSKTRLADVIGKLNVAVAEFGELHLNEAAYSDLLGAFERAQDTSLPDITVDADELLDRIVEMVSGEVVGKYLGVQIGGLIQVVHISGVEKIPKDIAILEVDFSASFSTRPFECCRFDETTGHVSLTYLDVFTRYATGNHIPYYRIDRMQFRAIMDELRSGFERVIEKQLETAGK